MALYHFPADLEQIISTHATEDGAPASLRDLTAAVVRLSDLFNGKVAWEARYPRDPTLRRAYLEYFVPVNLPKVRVPLAGWLAARPRRWAGRTLRCLDLGCGPGTALLGLADAVRGLPVEARPTALDFVGADLSAENLRDAQGLLAALTRADPSLPPLRFQPLRLDLFADRAGLFPIAALGGRFDLVIAANVLCELVRETPDGLAAAEALVRSAAADILAEDGAIVLIEPGLKRTSRDLHRLRDRLTRPPALHVHAPCLHQEPCPALDRERDWCTADLAWQPTQRVAELDRRTGLRKGSLKFSYLLLAPEPPSPPAATRWRVVSDVLELKGERRVYLCAQGRWIVVGQLRRAAGANEEAFARLRRGDLIEIDGIEAKGAIFRLPAEGRLRHIDERFSDRE